MENIVSYVKTNFDTFAERPFTEVDSLVLSWLSYLHFPEEFGKLLTDEGMSIYEIYKSEYFEQMLTNVKSPDETLALLAAAVASPRFRALSLFRYENQFDKTIDKQFAAVSFQVPDTGIYIAYRGTDSTFTGWKEDFNLVLQDPVPSQSEALSYINEIGEKTKGNLLVGGHSKGGNLAVYASANCKPLVGEKITAIYSHDGPGFSKEEVASEKIDRVRDRIHKTLPQSSLIGMLMEQECPCTIVHSNEKSVAQHNPFSWEVKGNAFATEKALTVDAKILYKMVNDWADNYSDEECAQFIDVLFDVIEGTGAATFDEMGANLKEAIPIIVKEASDMDPQMRKFMLRTFADLVKSGAQSVPETLMEQVKKMKSEA